MQNTHFKSKIKNAEKHAKNGSRKYCICFMEKTAPNKKTDNLRMRSF